MQRYTISVNRNSKVSLRDLINRPPENFVDAVDFLIAEKDGLPHDAILEFPTIGVLSASLNDREAADLKADPRVTQLREDRRVTGSPLPSPIRIAGEFITNDQPWHLEVINAKKCWPTTTGKGIKIGVIDSEIAPNLPFLPIKDGLSFNPSAPNWYEGSDFHGTFCAAIIGCRPTHPSMIGVAPDCDLYALRVNKNGSGRSEYLAAAIIWATGNKLDVLSMSQWDPDGADDPHELPWDDVSRAADDYVKAGGILVGIAGNSGTFPKPWVTNPGRCSGVVAVGGTKQDTKWWNGSSYGPDDLPELESVEIAAPGYAVNSIMPDGSVQAGVGTSFAAPQVAGACALLKQLKPDLTGADLRAILKKAARDLDIAGKDAKTGFGLLDCEQAVTSLLHV
ncbi:S8 family serine peptidase [Mesorhizobium kowhaii]|uniref:S8 family peptidase n=1 Tax=Mesorhizobium kowhaii TaxID=1300272 RepID=UPI0035E6AC6C